MQRERESWGGTLCYIQESDYLDCCDTSDAGQKILPRQIGSPKGSLKWSRRAVCLPAQTNDFRRAKAQTNEGKGRRQIEPSQRAANLIIDSEKKGRKREKERKVLDLWCGWNNSQKNNNQDVKMAAKTTDRLCQLPWCLVRRLRTAGRLSGGHRRAPAHLPSWRRF